MGETQRDIQDFGINNPSISLVVEPEGSTPPVPKVVIGHNPAYLNVILPSSP